NADAVSPMLLLNLARPLFELERHAEALELADRADALARRAGHALLVNQALRLRASIQRERGALDRAEGLLAELAGRIRGTMPEGHIVFGAMAMERALIAAARGSKRAAQSAATEAVAIAEPRES